jgi:hypothetical protein
MKVQSHLGLLLGCGGEWMHSVDLLQLHDHLIARLMHALFLSLSDSAQ